MFDSLSGSNRTNLFPGELLVSIGVNFLENVRCWRSVSDIHELHFEGKRRSSGNDVSGSSVAVSQMGRYRELSNFSDAHVEQTLVPAFYHLSDSNLERERSFSVVAETNERKASVKHFVPVISAEGSISREEIVRSGY